MSAQTLIDIDTLIDDADLVQLAERAGAHLRRSGDGYRGACPLHGGDNPSAFVIYIGDDGRQRWHCYTGCKGGGDALDFVMRQHHINDFVEGAQLLAEATG
jgi:DNA primase